MTNIEGDMINLTCTNRTFKRTLTLVFALSVTVLLTACSGANTNADKGNVVEVRATHNAEENRHLFEMSTEVVSPGWTTFEFNNTSGYDHFFLIWKVPEQGVDAAGDSLKDHWHRSITQPFQRAFNPYVNGKIEFDQFTDSLISAISKTAPWFFDPGAQTMGGPGFTAAGTISKTTVNLEPGEYIAECYVKNQEEVFHSSIGMLEHFSVAGEDSLAEKPAPTAKVTISSSKGIQVDQELSEGSHVVEIFFEDQQSYAHLQGHNVQLVQLSDKDDKQLLNNLGAWMDWRQPGSLVNRAPKGAEFLGGTMEMAGGQTAYFHVDLEPGDYAWIAEVPNPADHNMLKTFTITGESES